MMIPDRSPEKVTIEDLLRIKRAERPSAEFWTRFEQDLRVKQLAAIVEKRPWWHALHLPQAARVISRFQVPVGTAAILVLSFVVVNQYRPMTPSPASTSSEAAVPVAPVAMETKLVPSAQVAVVAPPRALPVQPAPKPVQAAVAIEPARMEIAVNSSALPEPSSELTAMIPWGVGQPEGVLPSARLLENGLQSTSIANLSVTSLLGDSHAGEKSFQASHPVVADVKPAVAQAASPRELRRAKILAGLVLADNSDGADYARVMHGRDIAANDLSEAQLYDSVHRVGVGGDRFTLKF